MGRRDRPPHHVGKILAVVGLGTIAGAMSIGPEIASAILTGDAGSFRAGQVEWTVAICLATGVLMLLFNHLSNRAMTRWPPW